MPADDDEDLSYKTRTGLIPPPPAIVEEEEVEEVEETDDDVSYPDDDVNVDLIVARYVVARERREATDSQTWNGDPDELLALSQLEALVLDDSLNDLHPSRTECLRLIEYIELDDKWSALPPNVPNVPYFPYVQFPPHDDRFQIVKAVLRAWVRVKLSEFKAFTFNRSLSDVQRLRNTLETIERWTLPHARYVAVCAVGVNENAASHIQRFMELNPSKCSAVFAFHSAATIVGVVRRSRAVMSVDGTANVWEDSIVSMMDAASVAIFEHARWLGARGYVPDYAPRVTIMVWGSVMRTASDEEDTVIGEFLEPDSSTLFIRPDGEEDPLFTIEIDFFVPAIRVNVKNLAVTVVRSSNYGNEPMRRFVWDDVTT